MKKEDIKKENKEKFEHIKRIRDKITHKVSPKDKEIIEKGVKQAWEEYNETFRALSETD